MAENFALIPDVTGAQVMGNVKESSNNLVSGDFERQYRNAIMEKSGRRRRSCLIFGVTVAVLVAWLLALTVVREVQLARLRQEVAELTANVIAITASVKSLNTKVSNELKWEEMEGPIYADEIDDDTPNEKKKPMSGEPLKKLNGLTILESATMPDDDEDLYDDNDDDGEESGYWYPDYDNRRKKIGTTNMVHLKPEDFTGTVMEFKDNDENASSIKKLKRLLNEDPEKDIVLVSSQEKESLVRSKRGVFPDSSADASVVDHFAAPRILAKNDERRKTKKYIPEPTKASLRAVSRIARNSNDGEGRPFIAAHFHGNTSHLNPEIHEHYKGNGLVRVAHGAAHDVWYPSRWTAMSPHPRPTLTRNGHVHVHHTGVYLVYAQIYYLDTHDIISWVLHRTNPDIEGRETLLQCAQSSHSEEGLERPNSCFSAAAIFLKAGDRLAVRNTGGDRHSLMEPEKSFIGLVKLADAEDPETEF